MLRALLIRRIFRRSLGGEKERCVKAKRLERIIKEFTKQDKHGDGTAYSHVLNGYGKVL